ncbi:putative di-and tripeptidase DUG2 OS=Saccharomyces cerevisiae (strain ATCC 204508 / S288c) GN=DUG2 PE=1 SV=1 [Rhizoctonia solani AG-1 IB]|uniref:Putative di-and tripeptidase DUG2 n=1 Tax=Thanatephorus cucumeris (strain AG1-IB / isolate 7/3/14) TaxID=1108050 RepID=A0A0B7G0R1_THACB|nr:putative di-and tripeptidase DUG2 OS=Saccharomyces cerevisiae (strain ATCC 204508 / S288c) GN=DUG2 PE=1 SV=1 [Rhizoctonia solani AG-1 IB]
MSIMLPRGPSSSLSRTPPPEAAAARLVHTLRQKESSVLSLTADERFIYSGSQGMDIYVWDRHTFSHTASLQGHTDSVLALIHSPERQWLFSSSGDSTVRIWCTQTLSPLYTVLPHGESGDIFSLIYVHTPTQQRLIFGCQNTSIQWVDLSPSTLEPPSNSCQPGVGDISPAASVYGSFSSNTGADNGMPNRDTPGAQTPISSSTPPKHKFFDSFPQPAGRPTAPQRPSTAVLTTSSKLSLQRSSTPIATPEIKKPTNGDGANTTEPTDKNEDDPRVLAVPLEHVVSSAHYGYIYCMALVRDESGDQVRLVTGSGDEETKLWELPPDNNPVLQHSFSHDFPSPTDPSAPAPEEADEDVGGAVLALAVRDGTIFAGGQAGRIAVWDVETATLVRVLVAAEGVDVLSLSVLGQDLYACTADGYVHRWSSTFQHIAVYHAHSGIILSSIAIASCGVFVTGAGDSSVKIWDVGTARGRRRGNSKGVWPNEPVDDIHDGDVLGLVYEDELEAEGADDPSNALIFALSKFVAIPSVSSAREDCKQAAVWLKKCFSQLGADSYLVSSTENVNSLVVATFRGRPPAPGAPRRPRILFYGHYDVISAPPYGWTSDPFKLSGNNGALYGRGVSDDKGPTLAVAFAVSSLLSRRMLDVDVVMLVEGEEEAGSAGFKGLFETVKDRVGEIDCILVSNSFWIDDVTPCVTYGLRGVVHSSIEISSERPDVHSGVEGGAIVEPMVDMVKVLATLANGSKVLIPSFYDKIRPQPEEERVLYEKIAQVTKTTPASIASRWSEPSLSIHSLNVSGPGNATVIPSSVKAKVSIRIVPDQDTDEIAASLVKHVNDAFGELQSPNVLKVQIDRTADWWLGELDDEYFHALEDAVRKEWEVEPLRIREGGSIPSVPFLEKALGCHALHLPMGQSSDQAHLQNERISVNNLRKGQAVVERFLASLGKRELS